MTDRELLEAAAKAAGMTLLRGETLPPGIPTLEYGYWSPLTDDAQALRLAVKLQFGLSIEGRVTLVHNRDGVYEEQSQDFGGDPYAATRRAIVRAAAALAATPQETPE